MIKYNIATISKRSTESSIVDIIDIHKACRSGDLATIKRSYHLDPTKINTRDENLGWTPLFRTVIFGHIKASKFLLKHGANPNIANSLGETPLHQAADNSQYIIAEMLLEYNADPNIQQNDGDTPLHHASFRGDTEMIEILLEHGGNPNIPNTLFGRTPLHFACDCGYEEAVLLMLQHKADTQIPDAQGKTPFLLGSLDIQKAIETFPLLGTVIIHQSISESQGNQESALDLPVTALSKWLDNLGIGIYHQDFISIGYDSLESIYSQMTSVFPITLEELLKIGINKLGHRYRILIKLEEDTGIFPKKVSMNNHWQCCSVPRKTQFGLNTTSLESWLDHLKLSELKPLFDNSGYDDYGYILIQMKSRYPINDDILLDIGINKCGFRNRLIGNLIGENKEKIGLVVENSQMQSSCELCKIF